MHPEHISPLRPAQVRPDQALDQLQYKSVSVLPGAEPETTKATQSRRRWWVNLKKYGQWWLVFAGIYASSSVCPFCGKPGCPVGPGAAGLIGLDFAWMATFGKNLRQRLRTLFATLRG
ncbi:MAG: hypothetical protein ACUVRZ_08590 [Desulfobacca sp.]|uniref:hypothetical protein n=1 Tax=Desulfobacca sp. TaxID=2067990 RepID=UPI0040499C34